jgi:hypothetical protein
MQLNTRLCMACEKVQEQKLHSHVIFFSLALHCFGILKVGVHVTRTCRSNHKGQLSFFIVDSKIRSSA